MVFDGRYYGAALPIPPVQYHPGAPAVGELAAGGLRAAYLYAQHQATLIGSQTWPIRLRRMSTPNTLQSTSMQRIAEWCAVHLAEHHTHIVATVCFYAPQVIGVWGMNARLIATDNTATVTGVTLTVQRPTEALPRYGEGHIQEVQLAVALSGLTLPTSAARVYVEAYATLGSNAFAAVPLTATAWRVTVP